MSLLGLDRLTPKGKRPKGVTAPSFSKREWQEIAAARMRGVSFEQIQKATSKRFPNENALRTAFYLAVVELKLNHPVPASRAQGGTHGPGSDHGRSKRSASSFTEQRSRELRRAPKGQTQQVPWTSRRDPWWDTVKHRKNSPKWYCPDCAYLAPSRDALWYHHKRTCSPEHTANRNARETARIAVAALTVKPVKRRGRPLKARTTKAAVPYNMTDKRVAANTSRRDPWWATVTQEWVCPDCGKETPSRGALWMHHMQTCKFGPHKYVYTRKPTKAERNGVAVGAVASEGEGTETLGASPKRTKRVRRRHGRGYKKVTVRPGSPVSREDSSELEQAIAAIAKPHL
jgi:predicted RNA-binding Zn-ribbon protein involved in translation (DUF1610 family)